MPNNNTDNDLPSFKDFFLYGFVFLLTEKLFNNSYSVVIAQLLSPDSFHQNYKKFILNIILVNVLIIIWEF